MIAERMQVFADVGKLEVAVFGMVHNRFDTLIIFQAGIYMAKNQLFVHLSLQVGGVKAGCGVTKITPSVKWTLSVF